MRVGIEGDGYVGDMVCEVLTVGWRCCVECCSMRWVLVGGCPMARSGRGMHVL